MKVEKLKGHSGCSLYLYKSTNHNFVRKISPNKKYNKRLFEQCNKQLVWSNSLSNTPRIIDKGYKNGLFYFDMEYILGSTLSSLLTEDQLDIDEVVDFIVAHYAFQFKEKKDSKNLNEVYYEKINELRYLVKKFPFLKNLDHAFDLLKNDFIAPRFTTIVHGDMTLENMIKSKKDNEIYLIDFLDDYSNSLYTDISKIFQDIQGGWSFFRNNGYVSPKAQSNLAVNLIVMKKKIINGIQEIDNNERFFQNTLYILLIHYIRIIPYIKDNRVYSFIDQKLEETIAMIEGDVPSSI
jgi:serine/threonine protein kinase